MKLSSESKLFLGIICVTIAIVAGAMILFSRPTPTISQDDLVPEGAITKGNSDATVFLVEFSDFQCPACKAVKPVVDNLLKAYPNELLFVYRHFPLSQHPFGEESARAAESASVQGKFWEMYEFLFANQENLSSEKIREGAAALGLDIPKFELDKESQAVKDTVARDLASGTRLGVNSTPTFYLNGRKLTLTSFEQLKEEVEKSIGETR
ncbi:MAG: thioredoxin domain-containing protein [bacterium]|nr:thioredoxin domain-containing protein [bacterium]